MALEVRRLAAQPVAMQRRLLRHAAERLTAPTDFAATEALRMLALSGKAGQKRELAHGLRAERTHRELRLTLFDISADSDVESAPEFSLQIPSHIEAFGVRLEIAHSSQAASPPDSTSSIPPNLALLRAWKPGDRVRLRHSSAPRKVKEVLERLKITGSSRSHWPVLEWDGRIVWMKGVELEPEEGSLVVSTILEDEEMSVMERTDPIRNSSEF